MGAILGRPSRSEFIGELRWKWGARGLQEKAAAGYGNQLSEP